MRQLTVSLELEELIRAVSDSMSEKQKRQYLAREALYLGYGGIAAISRISGVSAPTISKGIKEIRNGDLYVLNGRDRRDGGGQRKVTDQFKSAMEEKTAQDGVDRETDLQKIVEDALLDRTYGDPSTNERFTNVTPEKLAKELSEEHDYVITASSCRRIFIVLKYSRQQNAKLEQVGESHPMRDAQFLYREEILGACSTNGIPVISCDTKAKVKIGPFAVPGTEWRKPGDPRASLDHDFAYRFWQIYPDGHPELPNYFMDKAAIAVPYGVYCPSMNAGYTSIGISGDTSEFAANSICRWWESMGRDHFPNAKELLILVDGGGSNRSGGFLWKESIAKAAIYMGLDAIQRNAQRATNKYAQNAHPRHQGRKGKYEQGGSGTLPQLNYGTVYRRHAHRQPKGYHRARKRDPRKGGYHRLRGYPSHRPSPLRPRRQKAARQLL